MTETTSGREYTSGAGLGRRHDHDHAAETTTAHGGATDLQRLLLFVSLLGIAAFALRIADVLSVPALYLIPALAAYPLGRLLRREYPPSTLDVVYLTATFLGFGGILAFSSPYPIGYGDVQVHIAATLETVVDGRLRFSPESSVNFVALYLVVTALADLTGASVPAVARLLPLITFVATVWVFYYGIARHFLDDRSALFAAFVFGTNWGVFRFSVEFRTLNVALLILLMVVSLLLREWFTTHLSKENIIVYTFLITTLTMSHFTTYVFYLLALTVLVVVFMIQKPRRNVLNYLLISVVTLFGYMTYVGESLRAVTVTVGREAFIVAARLSGTAPITSGSSSTGGLVGLTYGYNMFVAEWALRLLFVLSFGLFVFGWLRRHERFGTVMILTSLVFGFGVLATSLIATFVNPSRVMTFFAIPYAFVYASGLFYAFHGWQTDRSPEHSGVGEPRAGRLSRLLDQLERHLTGPTARTVVRLLVVAIVLLAITSTLMKFPASIVGETEPVRTHQPIDDMLYLQFDGYELTARDFVVAHHEGPTAYDYGPVYQAGPFYKLTIEQPDDEIADKLDRLVLVGVKYTTVSETVTELGPRTDRMYDNGEVVLLHESAAVGRR